MKLRSIISLLFRFWEKQQGGSFRVVITHEISNWFTVLSGAFCKMSPILSASLGYGCASLAAVIVYYSSPNQHLVIPPLPLRYGSVAAISLFCAAYFLLNPRLGVAPDIFCCVMVAMAVWSLLPVASSFFQKKYRSAKWSQQIDSLFRDGWEKHRQAWSLAICWLLVFQAYSLACPPSRLIWLPFSWICGWLRPCGWWCCPPAFCFGQFYRLGFGWGAWALFVFLSLLWLGYDNPRWSYPSL